MNILRGIAAIVLLHVAVGCSNHDDEILVGMLERDRIAIPAELSEPVTALYVREGADVAAGDRILQLDDARAMAERARLAALVMQAKRRVDELVRGPREERIREARARLSAAEGQLQNARHEFERVTKLRETRLVSASALDAAKAARDARQGEHDAIRASLEALLEGATVEELDQARAQLAAAEAALRAQDLLVARLTVVAPRAGRVEALPYKQGAQPPRGAEVAVLLASGVPHARVYIPATWRETFVNGTAVTVRAAGFGEFSGRVRWVAANAAFTPYFALTERDRDRLSYAAEIELGDEAAALPAGVPVEVLANHGETQ